MSRLHVLAFHGSTGLVVVTTDDSKRATEVGRNYKYSSPDALVFIAEEKAEVPAVSDPGAAKPDDKPPPGGFRQGMPKNPTDT